MAPLLHSPVSPPVPNPHMQNMNYPQKPGGGSAETVKAACRASRPACDDVITGPPILAASRHRGKQPLQVNAGMTQIRSDRIITTSMIRAANPSVRKLAIGCSGRRQMTSSPNLHNWHFALDGSGCCRRGIKLCFITTHSLQSTIYSD